MKKNLQETDPELAKQWHPTKNGNLLPKDVTRGSSNKVQWYLPYDDPKTGNHFDFEWEAIIYNRVRNPGCPYISGNKVWPGFNDLKTVNPNLSQNHQQCSGSNQDTPYH